MNNNILIRALIRVIKILFLFFFFLLFLSSYLNIFYKYLKKNYLNKKIYFIINNKIFKLIYKYYKTKNKQFKKELDELNTINNEITLDPKKDEAYFYKHNNYKNSLTRHTNVNLLFYETWNSRLETPFWLSFYILILLLISLFLNCYLIKVFNFSLDIFINDLFTLNISKHEIISGINYKNFTNRFNDNSYNNKDNLYNIYKVYNNSNLLYKSINNKEFYEIYNTLLLNNDKNNYCKNILKKKKLKSLYFNLEINNLYDILSLGTYLETDDRRFQIKSLKRFNFLNKKLNTIDDLYKIHNILTYLENFLIYYLQTKGCKYNDIIYSLKYNVKTNINLNNDIKHNYYSYDSNIGYKYDANINFISRFFCQLLTLLIYKINIFIKNDDIILDDEIFIYLERHFIFINNFIKLLEILPEIEKKLNK